MWDLIVSVPDHCLSFYFKVRPPFSTFRLITANLRVSKFLGVLQ